jgi:hypothetical protein
VCKGSFFGRGAFDDARIALPCLALLTGVTASRFFDRLPIVLVHLFSLYAFDFYHATVRYLSV